MRHLLLFLVLLLPLVKVNAQDEPEYRMEIGAGVGTMTYEGDFNGSVTSGMRPMASVLARYVFNPYMGLKLSVAYGKIKGDSNGAETYYPDYVDTPYEFDRSLWDASLVYEYNFWPYGTGRDYRGSKRLTPFVFAGIGATYATGGATDNVFTANIPLGLGVKYKLAQRLNLGIEWAIHFSLSDELDGVKDPYGVKSTGIFKNTDCYSSLTLTLTYSFNARCVTCNKD